MLIKKSYIAAVHDIVMAIFSFAFALFLRLGKEFITEYQQFIPSVLIFTLVCAIVFSVLGLYKGIWRYASLNDMISIIKAATLATLVFVPILFMFTRLESFPRSVLIINWMVLLAFLGGPRLLYRMIKDRSFSIAFLKQKDDSNRIPVLLLGISDNAVNFIRATSNHNINEYRVVGILDSNKENYGRLIYGVKVFGGFDSIELTIQKLRKASNTPRRLILSQENIDRNIAKQLLRTAETLGFALAKLPKMSDFKENIDKVEVKPVSIEDLLGRAQKAPELGRRKVLLENKIILVTGAGGTIGSELVRQIATYSPKLLILLEISEFNLYKISQEIKENYPNISYKAYIADVRDLEAIEHIFKQEKPDLVFHAAALKHVPIVEDNFIEAVLTNVTGSKNIADISIKYQAQKMVMVSTDKAVNPTSLMGVTKRIAECYIQALGSSGKTKLTQFATVRFGNVLGSSGSVIPLFQTQLAKGGPITVTHPNITRYFMTVPEAVELILQASTIESNADKSSIFVLDMGEPILIKDLAIQMIKLAGLKPGEDIKIEYTGIRPGEKLYEELFYSNEERANTLYDGIKAAKAGDIDFGNIAKNIDKLTKHATERDVQKALELAKNIVPEYNNNL